MTDKSRKAVPREPTPHMLEAAFDAGLRSDDEDEEKLDAMTARIWRAMFDAAPVLATAPAEPPKEVAAREPLDAFAGMRKRLEFAIGHRSDDWRWWKANAEQTLRWLEEHERRTRAKPQTETADPSVAALIERLTTIVKSNDCRDHWELVEALKDALGALARLSAPVPDIDVAQDDLREILRAVGLSDCARPYSPHEVVQHELLPHLRALLTVIEKYDGNSNNPYWAEEFNQAVRIARAHLDKPHAAAPVPHQPDHATIRVAYDKWRGDRPHDAVEHAAFGAGYYLGRTNG